MSQHEISPIRLDNIDWTEVNRRPYYPKRGDVSSDTNEATVYKRADLPFVIKTFLNPEEATKSAQMADLLAGLVPQTMAATDVPVKIENRIVRLGTCLIQEKVNPLDNLVLGEFNDDPERIIEIIEDKAALDKEILARGVFLNDPKFTNYGLDSNGRVKVIDLGSATLNPFDSSGMERFLIRGAGHYFNYFALHALFSNRRPSSTPQGAQLAEKYAQVTDLTFNTGISTVDFLFQDNYLFALAKKFGPDLIGIALEDIKKHSEFTVPEGSSLPKMAASSNRDWFILPGGLIAFKPQS